jgi:DNA-binding NarL/FixJ family response regulator
MCRGLADLVDGQPDMQCCGCATNLAQAQRALATLKPDLVVADLHLGHSDGLEGLKSMVAQFPDVSFLIASDLDELEYGERALRAGARGYIMKGRPVTELLEAIRTVLSGDLFVSSRFSSMALQRVIGEETPPAHSEPCSLTAREMTVLEGIGDGKSSREIAEQLNLCVKTVEAYRDHIRFKIGLAGAPGLVQWAKAWVLSRRLFQPAPEDLMRIPPPVVAASKSSKLRMFLPLSP